MMHTPEVPVPEFAGQFGLDISRDTETYPLNHEWQQHHHDHLADLAEGEDRADPRRLQPDAALDLGMLGGSLPVRLAARALFALERFVYRRAALVATLTEGMRRRILSKGICEWT